MRLMTWCHTMTSRCVRRSCRAAGGVFLGIFGYLGGYLPLFLHGSSVRFEGVRVTLHPPCRVSAKSPTKL
jgi:hypothetical protein